MRRSLASGLILVAGLSLLALGNASGTGAIPVYPNPYTVTAHGTLGNATNGTNAYTETLVATQVLNTTATTVSCGLDSCYQLSDDWANVSNPFASALPSGAFPVAHSTFVNTTAICGNITCPAGFLQCDETFYSFQSASSTAIARPCFGFGVLWSPGSAGQIDRTRGGTLPRYTVTRILTYTYVQASSWTANGLRAVASIAVPSPSPSVYGAISTTRLTAWSVPQVWLAVPYPLGRWNLPATVVTWENESVTVAPQNVSYQSSAILLQWSSYPVSFCARCVGGLPNGTSINESYQISLLSLSGPPTLRGGNSSQSIMPAPPSAAPSEVVVFLGNVSPTSSTTFTASVDWTNPTSANFTGTIVAEAGFLGNATNVRVVVNGAVVASSLYTVTTGAIELLPGSVLVQGTTTVALLVDYTSVPSGTPNAVLIVLDGFPVTVADAILVAGGILGASYVAYWVERKQPTLIADDVLSFGIFVIAIATGIALSGGV